MGRYLQHKSIAIGPWIQCFEFASQARSTSVVLLLPSSSILIQLMYIVTVDSAYVKLRSLSLLKIALIGFVVNIN